MADTTKKMGVGWLLVADIGAGGSIACSRCGEPLRYVWATDWLKAEIGSSAALVREAGNDADGTPQEHSEIRCLRRQLVEPRKTEFTDLVEARDAALKERAEAVEELGLERARLKDVVKALELADARAVEATKRHGEQQKVTDWATHSIALVHSACDDILKAAGEEDMAPMSDPVWKRLMIIGRLYQEAREQRDIAHAALRRSDDALDKASTGRDEARTELMHCRDALDKANRNLDPVRAMRDAARRTLDEVIKERDAAFKERDEARFALMKVNAERDAALIARNSLDRSYDAAVQERNTARIERDEALKERDSAHRLYDAAVGDRNEANRSRDCAIQQRDEAWARSRKTLSDLGLAAVDEQALKKAQGFAAELLSQLDDLVESAESAEKMEREAVVAGHGSSIRFVREEPK